ncbi:alpha/beta fold hydrolase [Paenibacillus filicis]|uniref:Alpha/beta fold hydrolase n=1 Tax=Paenibacillus gyeongsangnamensis TaxID=3388067 RepID=A0ABT4Q8I5_9BACL|nr:alpha/beta fold hydrolase [Paenibacillus filicis]MCZ8513097.1 alpha/beta fold hydrolase [Paenibacillus filicis]
MMERHCLLLHGFTGGPFEVEPLAEHLRQEGYTCTVPTLPGHEDELQALGRATWHDWLDAAAAETHRLCQIYGSIDLVGFSMGGLIAAYLANRFPIRRLVLLSAAVIYVSPRRFVNHLAMRIRARDWSHLDRAKRTSLPAAFQFMKLARYARQSELPRVSVPTLVVQGEQDQIVHPRSAFYIYNRLQGRRELFLLPESRHMVCLEHEAPQLFKEVTRFLNQE